MTDNVVNFKLAKLFRTPAPWETTAEHKVNLHAARKAVNEAILARINGLPAQAATLESDADPRNPIVR